jgi:hypothetical protein
MKNHQLIAMLSALPADADVQLVFDGAVRSDVDTAWLTRSGVIALAPGGEYVSKDEDRTQDAPDAATMPNIDVHVMMKLPKAAEEEWN